jgi:protein-tyrosine phosphatase
MRPPTWIDRGRLIAGRHPSSFGQEDAAREVRELLDLGVTLFLDLTEDGELEPYAQLVAPARYLRAPMRDFSVPADDVLAAALDVIDAELESDGIVFVHCWAGCGRTGVVVGCWLVRHGTPPGDALAQIAAARGLGCPQTIEQRLAILDWEAGR